MQTRRARHGGWRSRVRTILPGLRRGLDASVWCIGRLQTDADRHRVVDGLSSSGAGGDLKELHHTLGRLAPRWFVVRNAHVPEAGNVLLNPRHTMAVLRGPLTRGELARAQAERDGGPPHA